jgi:3-methyladenine DNA glycosylase AlkD
VSGRRSAPPPPTAAAARAALREGASAEDAVFLQRFFKTGPGQYGAGDRFLGVRVPALRRVARSFRDLPLEETLALLRSGWHEERLLAVVLLADAYRGADAPGREAIYRAYLANTALVNNWDLVDASAPLIVGPHVRPDDLAPLDRLARSSSLWERRIAIVATLHWIRQGEFRPTLHVAALLLGDAHDLLHKAGG